MRKNRAIIFLYLIFTALVMVVGFAISSPTQTVPNRGRESQIVVNQVGYLPNRQKVAFLLAPDGETPLAASRQVELVDAASQKTVLAINTGKVQDAASSNVTLIDFSSFRKPGKYYLKFTGIQSYPFEIGANIYKEPFKKLLRSYYLQRCGIALADPVTGIRHPPCHLGDGKIAHQDKFHAAGEQLASTGGWHDAGDYGKYVATTAVTVGRLLSLFEQYPNQFNDGLAIPESGNNIPDLLDEVKVGLEWMLTMQRQDGAVYRKLSGKQWPPLVPPDADVQPRFIYGISTRETAKFAAAMAMAARVYKPYDTQLAQRYLTAAKKAWDFLQTEPTMKVDWYEGDDSGSGKYLGSEVDPEESLKTDKYDRWWAVAELFITTGNPSFERYLANNINSFSYTLFEWKDSSALGMADYLLWTRKAGVGNQKLLKKQIHSKLIQRADALLEKVTGSGYRLANQRFIWGSNKMAAEEGTTLVYAYQLSGEKKYLQAAIDQLDYLLGRNPLNQSFLTGVGSSPVRHVHHIFARAKKIDIPGLLVGGPNESAEDNIAPKSKGPLSYVDDERSYATNEYAIDYNASLIALMGMVMHEF